MPDRYAVPEDEPDLGNALVRAGVAAIPMIGGPINELLALVLSPAIDRRRREWMDVVAHGLVKLEEKVEEFSLASLTSRPDFLSSFMQAFLAALKSHESEKLDALRNSVLNVAIGQIHSESKEAHFLLLVEQYTVWHLRVLKYLHAPPKMLQVWNRSHPEKGSSVLRSLGHALPGVSDKFISRILNDIFRDGLVEGTDFEHFSNIGYKSITDLLQKRTTQLGDEFLAFIEAPAIVREGL